MGREISRASADRDARQRPQVAAGATGLSAVHAIAKDVEVGLLGQELGAFTHILVQ
jgi:hypothetical protein